METAELLKKVRKIEIKTKGLSNRIFSGDYQSAFKGRGMSFSEVREYRYGDDIKAIDWNVTARFGTPYVKVFEEERELTVMLLVDVSPSAFFGTLGQMKNEVITELCAVLAFSATGNNDKVGVIFFSDKIELFIPPKKGRSHVLRIIRELIEYGYGNKAGRQTPDGGGAAPESGKKTPWWLAWRPRGAKNGRRTETGGESGKGKTNLTLTLKYFNDLIKKKSIAFLLSDFMDAGYEKSLNIVARKHDLIGIHVYDKHEAELPPVGMLRVLDPETGKVLWLDSSSEAVRTKFASQYRQNFDRCKSAFAKSGADLVSIPTNQPYVKYLMNFFKKRGS